VDRQDFRGVLQVDGYVGFERLTLPGDIVLAACWVHARRKFYEVHQATDSPIAAEALRRIAGLYAIETTIRGQTSIDRKGARQANSLPLANAMKVWIEMQLGRVPPAGSLAEAIRYALARWPALTPLLDDGRIELDNNPVERAIRPVALGRKNHARNGRLHLNKQLDSQSYGKHSMQHTKGLNSTSQAGKSEALCRKRSIKPFEGPREAGR
jgi:transposase